MQISTLVSLVKGCQKGDRNAQAAFYQHYKTRLLGICRRYTRTTFEAEDIFQESFIKVFKGIGTLKEPEAVNFWVKSLVIRTAIDHFRKNRPFWLTDEISTCKEVIDTEDSFDLLSSLERSEIVTLINNMPDGYRTIINLYLIDGYEHHEIAEMLGISEGTSRSQLSRAKLYLKKRLVEHVII